MSPMQEVSLLYRRRPWSLWWMGAALALVGLVLAGCPKTSDVKKKDETLGKLSSAQLSALLATIRKERSKVRSLEGRAKLRVYHPNGRRSTYRLFFQLQRPNRLHFQITVAMQPVVIATSDGERCALYQLTQKVFWKGPAARLPRVLGRFLPPQIPLQQLVPILFGEMPVLPGTIQASSTSPKGLTSVSLNGAHHKQTLVLQSDPARFAETTLEYKGKPPLTLRYGTFRGKPALPKRVIFQNLRSKQRIVWIFYSYTVNPTIPRKSFQQPLPKGSVKIRNL